jgi:hypothetical protein
MFKISVNLNQTEPIDKIPNQTIPIDKIPNQTNQTNQTNSNNQTNSTNSTNQTVSTNQTNSLDNTKNTEKQLWVKMYASIAIFTIGGVIDVLTLIYSNYQISTGLGWSIIAIIWINF